MVPVPPPLPPGYVTDVLAVATGGHATGDIGLMQPLTLLSAITYLAGGLIFGIALFRAGILARWAAALLAGGTLATIAIPLLPQINERLFALPAGLALIGLGYSLWRSNAPRPLGPAQPGQLAARPGRHPVTVHAAARPTRSTGWVPFALVALVVVPAIAGSLRLIELINLAVAEYVIRRRTGRARTQVVP